MKFIASIFGALFSAFKFFLVIGLVGFILVLGALLLLLLL